MIATCWYPQYKYCAVVDTYRLVDIFFHVYRSWLFVAHRVCSFRLSFSPKLLLFLLALTSLRLSLMTACMRVRHRHMLPRAMAHHTPWWSITPNMAGVEPLVYECLPEKYWDTAPGAWLKCWSQCSGKDASLSCCTHESRDSPFVRRYKGVYYKRLLGCNVAAHHNAERGSFTTSLSHVVGFSRPYDQLFLISDWVHWVKEAHL